MIRNQKKEQALPPRVKSVTQWIWASLALIGMVLIVSGALSSHHMATCRSWPAVDGVIEISELQRGLVREGSLKYNLHIVYRYTVDNTQYRSSRISFSGPTRASRGGQDILRTYSTESRVSVHHHPTAPDLAVLDVTWSWTTFTPLILGLMLMALASVGLWRRWPLQTDYLFREHDPDAPLNWKQIVLGGLGMLTCLGIAWIWWELIKLYAGR